MRQRAKSPRKLKSKIERPALATQAITVHCGYCWHTNAIPISRFYDGYEGEFVCERCGAPLEQLEEE